MKGIIESGFDSRYFRAGGQYRRGAYIADDPTHSHSYTGSDVTERYMLIVKVALGKQEHLNAPANNKNGPQPGYHSILGTKNPAKHEYIIERWGQAQPLYLIKYK